jgi:hypothetical protein
MADKFKKQDQVKNHVSPRKTSQVFKREESSS